MQNINIFKLFQILLDMLKYLKRLKLGKISADKLITNTLIDLTNQAEYFIKLKEYDEAYRLLVDAHSLTFHRKYDKHESRFDAILLDYLVKIRNNQ